MEQCCPRKIRDIEKDYLNASTVEYLLSQGKVYCASDKRSYCGLDASSKVIPSLLAHYECLCMKSICIILSCHRNRMIWHWFACFSKLCPQWCLLISPYAMHVPLIQKFIKLDIHCLYFILEEISLLDNTIQQCWPQCGFCECLHLVHALKAENISNMIRMYRTLVDKN